MAGIRKKTWKTKKGQIKSCYEITYYVDGKLHRKAGYQTKQEAQNDLQNVTKTINSSILFKHLCEEHIKERAIRCKESSIIRYKRYVDSNLKHLHTKKAKEVRKKDIENTVNLLKQSNMANKTINVSVNTNTNDSVTIFSLFSFLSIIFTSHIFIIIYRSMSDPCIDRLLRLNYLYYMPFTQPARNSNSLSLLLTV